MENSYLYYRVPVKAFRCASPLVAFKLMKRLSRFLLFARTLLSSSLNEYRITGRVRWRVAPSILRAMFERHDVARGPKSLWWARMRGCMRCPLYDQQRRACGHLAVRQSDGSLSNTFMKDGQFQALGCQCFQPLKCSVEEATCFAFIESNGRSGVDWQAIRSTSQALTLESQSNGQSCSV